VGLRIDRVALIAEFVLNVMLGKIAELHGSSKVRSVDVEMLPLDFHPGGRLARELAH